MLVSDYSFTPVSKEHVLKMLIGLNSYKATGLAGVGLPGGPVTQGQPKGRRASQSHIMVDPVGQP